MTATRIANSETFAATTPADRQIVLTRRFDAPPRLVFEALTKPEHVRRWWGCLGEGYSVPVCEIDLRVGGAWRIVGRTPEGPMPAFYGVYREIEPPRRLVNTECFEPFPDAESVVTTELVADGDGTRMTVTATYPSREVRDIVLGTGMTTGAAASYDRLEEIAQELRG